jgi:multiple sugar transport system permease protein
VSSLTPHGTLRREPDRRSRAKPPAAQSRRAAGVSRISSALLFFDRRLWAYALVIPSLFLVGVVVIYPVASGIQLSFTEYRLNRPDLGQPFIGLQHYWRLLSDPIFRTAAVNTSVYVFLGVASQLVLGMCAAVLLNRKFRGRAVARMLVMLPWFLPPIVTAHMWSLMLDARLGVINDVLVRVGVLGSYRAWFADPSAALVTVLAVELWRSFPFFALFLLAGLQAIPDELGEAAQVDGAGPWSRFRHVTLPLLMPVIVVATVLQVIRLANIPDLLIVLTGGGPGNATQVLSLYAFLTAYSRLDFGYAAAISVTLMGGLMAFTMVYLRVSKVMQE